MGAAAVLGAIFDESLLVRIVPRDDCASALREARDTRVLVRAGSAGDWKA